LGEFAKGENFISKTRVTNTGNHAHIINRKYAALTDFLC